MEFDSYFRKHRMQKKITQRQLADDIKKKLMLMSNVENCKNGSFSDNDLKTIVSFLELSKDEERQLYKEDAKAKGKLPQEMQAYIKKMTKRIICSKHLQETSLEASLCLK